MMIFAIVHAALTCGIAWRRTFEIARPQLDRLMAGELVAGIAVVIAQGFGLHIVDALTVMQIARLMTIFGGFDTLVGAQPSAWC